MRSWIKVAAALAALMPVVLLQCTCDRGIQGTDRQPGGAGVTVNVPVRVVQERVEDEAAPRVVIEWERPFGADIASYSLTVIKAGSKLDDLADYMWQVVHIPERVDRVVYGEKPEAASYGYGGPAKELAPGEYMVQLFGYASERPDLDDPAAAMAGGRFFFTIIE